MTRQEALTAEIAQLDADQLRRLLKWVDAGKPLIHADTLSSAGGVFSPMAVAAGWRESSPAHEDHAIAESLRQMPVTDSRPTRRWQIYQTAGVEGDYYVGERARQDLRDTVALAMAAKGIAP